MGKRKSTGRSSAKQGQRDRSSQRINGDSISKSDDNPELPVIEWGGSATLADFIAWPMFGAFSALALISMIPNILAWVLIAIGLFGPILLLLPITAGAFEENAWIEGSRIQFPLMIGSLVLGEMLWFASMYYRLSAIFPQSFSQPMTPASSVYFSVTAWTTTGFGDIHPQYAGTMLLVASELIIAAITVIVVLGTAVSKAFSRRNGD